MRYLLLCLFFPACATGGVDFQRVAFYQGEVRALRDKAVAIRAAIAEDRLAGKSNEAIALEIGLAVQQVVLETVLLPPESRPAQ